MGKIILDFGEGWNARFLESVYKNNDYEVGSMADDMIRMRLKESIITDESNITNERKKGKWVNKSHTSGCGIKFTASECTCCGKKTFFDCDQLIYNYCPNCGARMSEGEL